MNLATQIIKLSFRLGHRAIGQRANQLMGLCIMMCSLITASMGLFSSSVQTSLNHDIANFLGAPLVVVADRAVPTKNWPRINGLNDPVITSSFTTGATHKNSYQSIALKAVSSAYPLQGNLSIRTNTGEFNGSGAKLEDTMAWLDRRALDELNLKLGDQIQVGRASLTVSGEILFEPDRLTQLQHVLPRVMVSMQGLIRTGVAVDNDRGEYRLLFDAQEPVLAELESRLPSLINHDFHILTPAQGNHPFSRMSLRAERLLNIVLVLLLLICGGAASMLADHSARLYAIPATILRCMGLNRAVVTVSLCLLLGSLTLVSSLIGCVIAWLIQPLFATVMEPHMTLQAAPFALSLFLVPMVLSILMVFAFVAPKLQQLGSLPINQILRDQLGKPKRLNAALLSVLAIIVALLYLSSDNTRLTTMVLGAVAIISLLAIIFGWCLTKLSSQFHRLLRGPLKVAVRSIGRSPKRHSAPLISIAIAVMAILMTATLRGSFLDMLQVKTLETDGDTIFTGLPSEHKGALREALNLQGIDLKGIYPTVSAKLYAINGISTEQALSTESDTREETRSKVRLSWSDSIPANNVMVDGSWPTLGSGEVSVEQEVMTDLGLKIGDELSFEIDNKTLHTKIASSRKYQGGESRMMFWFMFAPDALASFEQRLMGGILLGERDQSSLTDLSRLFPQIRITSLQQQIDAIRNIMIVITRLMNTLLLLLLGAALMVITASAYANSETRTKQLVLMRSLGLPRKHSFLMNIVEQLCIALVASLIGVIGAQAIAGMMFHEVFALSYQPDWAYLILIVTSIGASFVALGSLFTYRSLAKPAVPKIH